MKKEKEKQKDKETASFLNADKLRDLILDIDDKLAGLTDLEKWVFSIILSKKYKTAIDRRASSQFMNQGIENAFNMLQGLR